MGRIQGFPAVFFFFHFGLFAQTLQLSSAPASVAPGDRFTIDVSLSSPDGADVSALQWDITAPPTLLRFLPQEATTGAAVHAAGKSVNCAPKASGDSASGSTSICMLYGGRESIPNGVVARLVFHVSPDAAPGPARIRVSQGLAVSKDLKRIPLKDAEIDVRIQPK